MKNIILLATACLTLCSCSNTANKLKVVKGVWKIYRNEEGFGYLKSIWCFLNYAFNAVKKRV